ncbi:hypothetical protein LJB93_03085 [Desulfovibrio sp. OttesenSCG-928-F07]|nr:hypothetical protein [Desulfovibrio sp. OttesenSCG-928-F07]
MISGLFAPEDGHNENIHRRQIARAANSALRGQLGVTGKCKPNAQVYTLKDSRLGMGRTLFLTPRNIEAATIGWFVGSISTGQAIIEFTANPAGAEFDFMIIGIGKPEVE